MDDAKIVFTFHRGTDAVVVSADGRSAAVVGPEETKRWVRDVQAGIPGAYEAIAAGGGAPTK